MGPVLDPETNHRQNPSGPCLGRGPGCRAAELLGVQVLFVHESQGPGLGGLRCRVYGFRQKFQGLELRACGLGFGVKHSGLHVSRIWTWIICGGSFRGRRLLITLLLLLPRSSFRSTADGVCLNSVCTQRSFQQNSLIRVHESIYDRWLDSLVKAFWKHLPTCLPR